jgi:catechol 2,3-dioxygenase-like lactoylglutathione lyase family enzyme
MPATPDHERPALWVGHVALGVTDLAKSTEFYLGLGTRLVEAHPDRVSVLELRGGTHLLLLPTKNAITPGTPVQFDLMVDDVDAMRADFEARGLRPSEMRSNPVHRSFTLQDPNGYVLVFNSSHATGKPV